MVSYLSPVPRMKKIAITKTAKRPPNKRVRRLTYDVVSVADLSSDAYATLKRLNLGKNGLMQADLMMARKTLKKHPQARDRAVCAIAYSDKDGIIGWGLLFNELDLRRLRNKNSVFVSTWIGTSAPRWTSHFYVKKDYRGCGIGSELISRLSLVRRRFHTYKHTAVARGFFRKNGR